MDSKIKKYNFSVRLILIVLLCPSFSFATGINKLIKNVMPSGTMHNSTKSAIVRGQSAGHLIGGSVMIKTPAQEELQLLNLQPPTCKLGGLPCGAQIDLRAGGFSFISSTDASAFFKKVVQGVPSYATLMMVKTVSPQIEELMTYLNDLAATANKLAIDQCAATEALAKAPLSLLNAGSRATRQSASVTNGNGGRDMIAIQESSIPDSDDSKSSASELESLLGDNYNLVWKALEKKSMRASGDSSFRELLMSISGTIIGTKKNQVIEITHKNSLVSKDLLKEFIGTTDGDVSVKLYRCDSPSLCLDPQVGISVRLNADDTLMGQVTKLLKSISEKIYLNTAAQFTPEEESLISLSTIPIIRKIEMDLATYKDPLMAVYAQGEFVEALCYDVATSYLATLLSTVSTAVGEMSRIQLTDRSIFDDFQKETRNTMRLLGEAKADSFRRYDLISQSKAMLMQQESYFHKKFEEYINQGKVKWN